MEDSIAKFLDYLKYEKRSSEHTVTAYEGDLAQFETYLRENFSGVTVLETEPLMVRAWMMELIEGGDSARTVNRKVSALRAFFRYHVKLKNVTVNPMEAISSPKIQKRLPQFVEEGDMENLFSEDLFEDTFEGWRDRLIFELFYATGMRLSELTNIRRNDIDLYACTVKVLGKRNKERIIPFSPRLKEVILKYFSLFDEKYPEIPKNYYIFVAPNCNKIYPKAVYRIVRKYLDLVTTIDKRSPHVLRHTFATHLLNHGADINAIKEILGHASLAATQVYTHNSIEKLKNIYNQAHPRA
ncbi:MAG: tyrosine-type recombinase/integrase [Bacteroidales bacterium]|nr:tyrosine-type recombinase/integrase [Bacteroidales bacterium]